MRKSLIAIGVLGALSLTAYAESQVTLFGVLEEGVLIQKNSKAAASVQLRSGFDEGSRWGIRGYEDLGGANRVGFILDQGIYVDDGTVGYGSYGTGNSGFTRESILYAEGDWGNLAFGRTGALSFTQTRAILTGWAFSTSYGLGAWSTYGNNFGRMNNVVSYVSPDLAGFKLSLMYSNGAGSDTEQWSHNDHYYGIGFMYQANNIRSSLIYENVDWKGAWYLNNSNDVTNYRPGDQSVLNFGFEYTIGDWTPMFAYEWNHTRYGTQTNMFGLSTKVALGGGNFLIGVRYIFGKNTSPQFATYDSNKIRLWNVNIGYVYPISKRTAIKAFAGYSGASKLWREEYFTGSQTTIYNGYQIYLALRHSF